MPTIFDEQVTWIEWLHRKFPVQALDTEKNGFRRRSGYMPISSSVRVVLCISYRAVMQRLQRRGEK